MGTAGLHLPQLTLTVGAPQEMNKLRSELYSDSGLGSIRSELDALRSGGLEQIQQQVEQIRTLTLGLGLGLTLAQQVEQIEAA